MSYEREAIAPNDSAIPTQPQMQMREERTIDPYRHISRPPKSGQPDTSAGIVTDASAGPGAPTAESVNLSPAAAALARKEQKHRQDLLALKAKETALEKERLEIAEFKALKAKLDSKDYSAIEGMVPYDEYTNYHVNKLNGSSPEAQRVDGLEKKLTDLEKKQADDIAKRFETAVNERRTSIKELIESKPEFARLKKANATEHVLQYILDTWEHDSVDLDPEKAAMEVDMIMQEKAKQWATLLEEDKKPEVPAEVDQKKELPPLKSGVKTLTNNMTTTGDANRPKKSLYGMSDSERWAEARRRAEEKLALQKVNKG